MPVGEKSILEVVLERLFQLRARQTTVRAEILGGATTFVTMAYIIVVNPAINVAQAFSAE